MTTEGAGGRTGHEVLDHTSEIVLRLRASTFPELVAEAARGFADLVPDRLRASGDGPVREIRVSGSDRARILVDLLNELVFLAEAECWIPTEVEVHASEGAESGRGHDIVMAARGLRLTEPFVLVKAATLHDLDVREKGDGLEASVTLDV